MNQTQMGQNVVGSFLSKEDIEFKEHKPEIPIEVIEV